MSLFQQPASFLAGLVRQFSITRQASAIAAFMRTTKTTRGPQVATCKIRRLLRKTTIVSVANMAAIAHPTAKTDKLARRIRLIACCLCAGAKGIPELAFFQRPKQSKSLTIKGCCRAKVLTVGFGKGTPMTEAIINSKSGQKEIFLSMR
jgi:hypothetical protein